MPGGFARISDQIDARAVSMGEGVLSADVWVLAEGPVAMTTLLPTDDNIRIRRKMGNLAIGPWIGGLAWAVAALIVVLNVKLLFGAWLGV